MRTYNDLTIDTIVLTACCGAYAVAADGSARKHPKQVVRGESLTCEGCGKTPELVEEDVAWEG
jgi:hypothetical protein